MMAGIVTQNHYIQNKVSEMLILNQQQMSHYNMLSKYVLDLTVVAENLNMSSQELIQALYENSFKMVRDGTRIFGGFSPEEIVDKIHKSGDMQLSESDIDDLKNLFLGSNPDQEESDDDPEEAV